MHRAIAIISPRRFWLFVYLFAKKDRENIDADELAGFKKLANDASKTDEAAIGKLLRNSDFVEILDESEQNESNAK